MSETFPLYEEALQEIEKRRRIRLFPRSLRTKIVYRWVDAKRRGYNDQEAQKYALSGINPLVAIALANLLINLLRLWWSRRNP